MQFVGDTVYALDRVYPGEPGFTFANLVAATWHVAMLMSLLVLTHFLWSRLGHLGRAGIVVSCIGLGLLIAAEVVTQAVGAIPVVLIATSAPLAGVGLILAGAGCLKAGLDRLLSVAVLMVGLYAVAVIVPTSAGPAGANYHVIAGWGLTWLLLGAATVRARFTVTRTGAERSVALGYGATR